MSFLSLHRDGREVSVLSLDDQPQSTFGNAPARWGCSIPAIEPDDRMPCLPETGFHGSLSSEGELRLLGVL